MKIVKFKDGNYAIRKGIFAYKYLDLESPRFWWEKKTVYFKFCTSKDLNIVKKAYKLYKDPGKIINSKLNEDE